MNNLNLFASQGNGSNNNANSVGQTQNQTIINHSQQQNFVPQNQTQSTTTTTTTSLTGLQQQQQQQKLTIQPFAMLPGHQTIAPAQVFNSVVQNSNNQNKILDVNHIWQKTIDDVRSNPSFKTHELPLARIKKIMKLDDEVQMISAEAPVVFSKACELFIIELTCRSWYHTNEAKRRTLQRSDIAMAVSNNDVFDFLIDIVPREEAILTTASTKKGAASSSSSSAISPKNPVQIQSKNASGTPTSLSGAQTTQDFLPPASNVTTSAQQSPQLAQFPHLGSFDPLS